MTTVLNGTNYLALIDTGASVSLISETLLARNRNSVKIWPYDNVVRDASGNIIPIKGLIQCKLVTPAGYALEKFLVVKKEFKLNVKILIGMNVLQRAKLDFQNKHFILNVPFEESDEIEPAVSQNKDCLVLTLPRPSFAIKRRKDLWYGIQAERSNKPSELEINEAPSLKFDLFPVHICKDTTLPKNSVNVLSITLSHKLKNGQEIVITNAETKNGIVLAGVVTTVKNGNCLINAINLNDHDVTLSQGTKLTDAYLNPTDDFVNVVNQNENRDSQLPPITADVVNCSNPKLKPKLIKLLNQYRQICWLKGESLGHFTGDPLEINLTEDTVINQPPYRIPHSQQGKLNSEIQTMLKDGVITRSKSSFNSPLILVPKPDKSEIRICIDYRKLNSITRPVTFPIPRIADLLSSLGQTKIISSLDLASAYHQCEIHPKDREKTAFTVQNTKYQYQRVPFGLTSAPGYFSRVVNETLFDVLGPQVVAYLDDILIFTQDEKTHFKRLTEVLERLAKANLKLKLVKCKFFTDSIKFLGYKISKDGMTMDDERITSIQKMPYPTNKRQVQAFLGACNYFRTFVREFAKIADPLYVLLRKNVKFLWGAEQAKAVDELKRILSNAPVLRFPNFDKTFHIHTDASLTGIGACLLQEHEGILHPISYVSKNLSETQRNYSATKREFLALVFALEQFRHLILQYKVEVYTDHRPLLGILYKKTKDPCMNRWSLLVQEYKIILHYLPGKENIFSDVLSRLTDVTSQCETLTNEFEDKLIERINTTQEDGNDEKEFLSFIPKKMPWTHKQLKQAQKSDHNCIEIRKKLKDPKQLNKKLIHFKVINAVLYCT